MWSGGQVLFAVFFHEEQTLLTLEKKKRRQRRRRVTNPSQRWSPLEPSGYFPVAFVFHACRFRKAYILSKQNPQPTTCVPYHGQFSPTGPAGHCPGTAYPEHLSSRIATYTITGNSDTSVDTSSALLRPCLNFCRAHSPSSSSQSTARCVSPVRCGFCRSSAGSRCRTT